MPELLDLVETGEPPKGSDGAITDDPQSDVIWVGSVGYEQYRNVDEFVKLLYNSAIEQLIDVRELPISRRRGYAKSALAAALGTRGIDYVHIRSLGNPKSIRDLWKAGAVAEGRKLYRRHLLAKERDALEALPELLRAKRSALMCIEHEEHVCHRQVIFECLRERLGVDLTNERLGTS